jgi:3-oxoacyl-[acyl-carrier protein] reductase
MDLGLAGKVVFVAGSSRGVGLGIARTFLDEGARVVLTGRNPQALESAAGLLPAGREERVCIFAGDLSDTDVIHKAHRQITSRWGLIDVLVCNVGSGTGRAGFTLAPSDWSSLFEVNFWTTIRLVEVFLPAMVEAKRGAILFISSIAGLESLGAPLPYGAAKAALEKYSKDLSRQVAAHGIRVNTIAPGNILFEGGSWQRKLDADRTAVSAMIAREVPLARFGDPEEIGAATAFLASDCARFITGAHLVADGGQTRA